MRQVLLQARGVLGPALETLDLDEAVWEQGYGVVMATLPTRPLHVFWCHHYGASAQMSLSGHSLALFLEDIRAILPGCSGEPTLVAELLSLEALSKRAWAEDLCLQVVAD